MFVDLGFRAFDSSPRYLQADLVTEMSLLFSHVTANVRPLPLIEVPIYQARMAEFILSPISSKCSQCKGSNHGAPWETLTCVQKAVCSHLAARSVRFNFRAHLAERAPFCTDILIVTWKRCDKVMPWLHTVALVAWLRTHYITLALHCGCKECAKLARH